MTPPPTPPPGESPVSLRGRTAVVTGAGRGLGRAEALELARLGAAVVVNDHGRPGRDGSGEASPAPAEAVVEEIRAAGGRATAHVGDVADFEQARALVRTAVDTYGSLDVLVNNAGILRDRMVFSMAEDEWDAVIRVHLKGHFNTTRFAAAHWRERSKAAGGAPVYGRIVNTSSEAFLAGSAGQPNYAAAKGGIVGLTTSTAHALRRYGVTVNAICPRARTRMTEDVFAAVPAGGGEDPLAPEHVSPLVAYLASPAAGEVTGQVFVAHGGMVAVIGRPTVAACFEAKEERFGVEELAAVLTPYHLGCRDEGFAAPEVLGLKRRTGP
ncbi:3-oxoacyl-ACP reductase [Streptomyces triculaminicus]|uniref:3-oxoacyl-ACP reductase n=1 Tax=Streptomyces triculaminicus TaxID=2816232 RepID=A0A939FQU3_9ACTN|nr:3-oxoacyl-ACP reductase [Streptomyces triculaminicus]MBO0656761.1 3-oxoacyl-ACP reductase [Streptomyces triculaminicus]